MNEPQSTNISVPSFAVNVTRLPKLGTIVKLDITDKDISEANRQALVLHLGVQSLEQMSAQLTFKPWQRDGVKVEGEVVASLHTQCSVSLDNVPQYIKAAFTARFVSPSSKLAKPQFNEDGEMVIDFDGEDIPDIYEGETLDAWAIALEYLLLEIDFFARAEGAEFKEFSTGDPEDDENASPFAVLQSLKK